MSRTLQNLAAIVSAGLMSAACSMAESIPIGPPSTEPTLACKSNAGAYYLPRTVLKVEVYANTAGRGDEVETYDITLSRTVEADERFGFCLDYLTRTTGDDKINIKKFGSSNLLQMVSTDAVDQTRYVMQTLIRSLFVVASGNPQFPGYGRAYTIEGDVAKYKIFQAEYDPFDAERTARINETLKQYGYCLVLGAFSVNAPAGGISAYCDHPRTALKQFGAFKPSYRIPEVPEDERNRADAERRYFRRAATNRAGIFYRPRVPYRIELYRKVNLRADGNWRLRATRQVPMENISPLVLAQVDRTLFAQRKTTLMFAGGMLEKVCLYKQSEALQASYIPVQIVASVVALPTQVLQVRIDQTKHQAELAEAQQELLKTQYRILQLQQGQIPASSLQEKGSPTKAVGDFSKGPTGVAANPDYVGDPDGPNKYSLLKRGIGDVASETMSDQDWNTSCPTKAPTPDPYDPVRRAIDQTVVIPNEVIVPQSTPPAPQSPNKVP